MPAALLIALALQAAPAASDPDLAELRRTYDQSCGQRDYGAFSDVCNDIADEIAAFERTHPDRAARERRRPPGAPSPGGDRPMPEPAKPNASPVKPEAPPPPPASAPSPSPPASVAPAKPTSTAGDIAADDVGATALAEALGKGGEASSD